MKKDLSNQPIVYVCSDRNNVKVGSAEGVVHHLEVLLGHQLHYFIYQFYDNELPFQSVFYKYNGKLSSPEH